MIRAGVHVWHPEVLEHFCVSFILAGVPEVNSCVIFLHLFWLQEQQNLSTSCAPDPQKAFIRVVDSTL